MFAYFLFTIFVGLFVRYLLKKFQLSLKQPPGPVGLPIVGYVPFLTKKPHLELEKQAKKYGNIFRLRLGSCNVIILNDYESTKEAFSKDAFMGRPRDFGFEYNDETLDTKAFMGLPWKEHRRFSLHMLRDLGLGKSKIEGFIQEEIEELLHHLKKNAEKPFVIHNLLASSVSNIISAMIFGKRLPYDDPNREMTTRVLEESVAQANQAAWLQFIPWLKQTIKFLGIGNSSKIARIQGDLKDYIMMEINEHEKTFDPNNIRDFIDGYLFEIQKRKDDSSFCKPVVQDIAMLFFAGGSETIRTSVEWLLLTAATYQDFQRRIHLEIDEAVGRDQIVSWENRSSMPFTEAFINELMRWITILPLNLLRYYIKMAVLVNFSNSGEWLLLTAATYQYFQRHIHLEIDETVRRDQLVSLENRSSMSFTEAFINELMRWITTLPLNLLRYTLADGELGGYFIPKGSYIMCNLWAIHHDADYWGKDAEEFRPERFLTDDGKAVKRLDHLMPFSIGKRACPGEPLAKVEVFMYFVSILQKFHVRLPEGSTPDFEGEFGATLTPKLHDLIYTIRS